jgi:hypothetical protein
MAAIYRRVAVSLTVVVSLSACEKSRITSPSAAAPSDPVHGTYTLTVSAGDECGAIPAAARNRSYTATINGTPQRYVVTLSGASFARDIQLSERSWSLYCNDASGLGCNQFTAVGSPDGSELEFQLVHNSERLDNEFGGHGGTIVELITPDTRLEVYGRGRGRFERDSIEASLTGFMWYCSPIEGCDVWARSCETSNLQLSFTRR